jgi:hypothetical protein
MFNALCNVNVRCWLLVTLITGYLARAALVSSSESVAARGYSLCDSHVQTYIGTEWFKSHLAPKAKYYTPNVNRRKWSV